MLSGESAVACHKVQFFIARHANLLFFQNVTSLFMEDTSELVYPTVKLVDCPHDFPYLPGGGASERFEQRHSCYLPQAETSKLSEGRPLGIFFSLWRPFFPSSSIIYFVR